MIKAFFFYFALRFLDMFWDMALSYACVCSCLCWMLGATYTNAIDSLFIFRLFRSKISITHKMSSVTNLMGWYIQHGISSLYQIFTSYSFRFMIYAINISHFSLVCCYFFHLSSSYITDFRLFITTMVNTFEIRECSGLLLMLFFYCCRHRRGWCRCLCCYCYCRFCFLQNYSLANEVDFTYSLS